MVDSTSRATKVYCNSNQAVFYSKNNKRSSCSKYTDFKYYVVRESIKDGHSVSEHTVTKNTTANLLTKTLFVEVFKSHTTKYGFS